MAATGVVLSLENAVVGFAERRRFVAPPDGAERIAAATLVESARLAAPPGAPFEAASLRYDADPRAPVQLVSRRGERVYMNSYTGEVVGRGAPKTEAFFEGVRRWHRWLAVSESSVRHGRSVTGAANVAFLFLLLSGMLIWFPRRFNRRTFVASIIPLWGAWGQARAFNWHKVGGFWAVSPLLVIAASAILLSYPSVGDRLYPVAGAALRLGSVLPESSGGALVGLGGGPSPSLDAALATAQSAVPGWRSIVVHVPRDGDADAEIAVEVRTGWEGQPQRTASMTVDPGSGTITRWEAFGDASPGRRAQQFFRYAHTGEYWGPVGQALAALASVVAVALVWTGAALAWNRAVRWARVRRRAAEAPPQGPPSPPAPAPRAGPPATSRER